MRKNISLIALLIVVLVTFGTIYATVQQAQRGSANDPQIQLAEDTAASLRKGGIPRQLAQDTVDISASLAPFVIIYSQSGAVLAGNGQLNGSVPQVPLGVLRAAKGREYHAVTWQPVANVRIA